MTTPKKKITKKKDTKPKLEGRVKWDDKLKPVILNLAKRGNTNQEIAELLGVCEKTFYNWLNKYCPELVQSLREAKKDVDEAVEAALFKMCVGYDARETKTHLMKTGVIKTQDVIKHYPPNFNAQKFWLINRRPEVWRSDERQQATPEKASPKFGFSLSEAPDELDSRGGEDVVGDDDGES